MFAPEIVQIMSQLKIKLLNFYMDALKEENDRLKNNQRNN